MSLDLVLLDGVAWRGVPVVGDRSRDLLAALVDAGGRPVRAGLLVERIWGDRSLADPAKALQVLVSRTRAACGPDVVVRDGDGYRLGIATDRVDACRLHDLAARATRALSGDTEGAAVAARDAVALAGGIVAPEEAAVGPLAELLRAADLDAGRARVVLARTLARAGSLPGGSLPGGPRLAGGADPGGSRPAGADARGPLPGDSPRGGPDPVARGRLPGVPATDDGAESGEDLLPVLLAAHAADADDEGLLADLLLAEAAVRGPAVALERYEVHRRALRDRTGSDPGPVLQRVQRDLLARDRPVREGVRFDATELLGRDDDVRRLRSLLHGSRVVSIVGPGGLGKTRLAHVLARDASQPVVHVVELVGVTAPEDVVGELGSALGVRDSVRGRRALTPEQRADARSRIAQHLGQGPSLLVLDNCEHVIDAVAPLVAFLVSATADLRVLTTTRSPLGIAAEQVYPLGTLGPGDAARLFRRRALAARPDARLDDAVVARIAGRLDGLPLAIELAAAKVRAMAVEEVDRRLENRFALLRGSDRGAPDRHRTLIAVIDWSWNLLEEPERRGLRRLAVFHDGFTLDAAEAVLGDDAVDVVERLADQSLLVVRETSAGVRHRMLETVREFGRMQLVDAGEDGDALRDHRAWSVGYAWEHGVRLFGTGQFAAVDALAVEEGNLADALHRAMEDRDRGAVARLVTGLGGFWSIRGDHGRILSQTASIAEALAGWAPSAEDLEAARAAVVLVLTNAMVTIDEQTAALRELLGRLGTGEDAAPHLRASLRLVREYEPGPTADFPERLEALGDTPDRHLARVASLWASHARENGGDPGAALRLAERALALTRPEDGPWAAAILHTQIAELRSAVGDAAGVAVHARAALPVLERLGAGDDRLHLLGLLALSALTEGRLGDADAAVAELDTVGEVGQVFGGRVTTVLARAELLLARGRIADGLAAYRDVVAQMRDLTIPGIPVSGYEPWVVFGESTALAAFARHGGPADEEDGAALFRAARDRALGALRSGDRFLDYPVTGLALFGLGTWATLRAAAEPETAAALLVLGERCRYSRAVPSMAWEPVAAVAERRAPGCLDAWRARLGDRRGARVRADAEAIVAQLGA